MYKLLRGKIGGPSFGPLQDSFQKRHKFFFLSQKQKNESLLGAEPDFIFESTRLGPFCRNEPFKFRTTTQGHFVWYGSKFMVPEKLEAPYVWQSLNFNSKDWNFSMFDINT